MGSVESLLTLPVLGPVRALLWVARAVATAAERELYDEDAVLGRLQELDLRNSLGQIREEDRQAAEEALLERLRVIRARKAS